MSRWLPLILLSACAVESADPALHAADTVGAEGLARGGMTLSAGDAVWGSELTYTVTGAGPGEVVRFILSTVGEGEDAGMCPPPLGGLCLDVLEPTSTIGNVTADDLGVAELVVPLPDLCAPGRTAWVQAGSVRPAPMLSNVLATLVEGIPLGGDDAYVTDEDMPLDVPVEFGVLRNDRDCGGEGALRAVLSRSPSSGTLTLNGDGSFTYAPEPDFAGDDEFRYTVVDDGGRSAPVIVALTVDGVRDAPVAVADAYAVPMDTALEVDAPGLLANDWDADGDVLAATLRSAPRHGTLSLSVDGAFTYEPDPGYVGVDTFEYVATDGALSSAVTTVTITVEG